MNRTTLIFLGLIMYEPALGLYLGGLIDNNLLSPLSTYYNHVELVNSILQQNFLFVNVENISCHTVTIKKIGSLLKKTAYNYIFFMSKSLCKKSLFWKSKDFCLVLRLILFIFFHILSYPFIFFVQINI